MLPGSLSHLILEPTDQFQPVTAKGRGLKQKFLQVGGGLDDDTPEISARRGRETQAYALMIFLPGLSFSVWPASISSTWSQPQHELPLAQLVSGGH